MLSQVPTAIKGKDILHFAPEKQLERLFSTEQPNHYVTADIRPGAAQNVEDMTKLTLKDKRFDLVIANHVLEHIPDDARAFSEVHRILRNNGEFWAAVPVIEGWNSTYENSNIQSEKDRARHFGQHNHVRYYGRDFIERFEKAGFAVTRFQAAPQDCVKYSLSFGESIFIGRKFPE
jgi:SAM-dependent methyltransferase